MKVVQRIGTKEIAYGSHPEFATGFGIKNAIALFGGKPEDYKEVEVTDSQWQQYIDSLPKPYDPKAKIEALEARLTGVEEKLQTIKTRTQ